MKCWRRLIVICAVLAVSGWMAEAQEPTSAFLRKPDIWGDQVVFTSEGDLWLGSLTAKTARRITSHAGTEINAHFSPDGKQIAFTGQYDGGSDVYVMPVAGGPPKRLTYDPSGALVLGWTPDGKNILFRSRRKSPTGKNQLFSVPANGGMPTLLPIPQVEHAAMNADGHRIAYVPVSAEWQHWFHYRGGEADDIWLTDTTTHAFRKLTDFPGIDTTPTWIADKIYFVSERAGLANMYRLDPATTKTVQITHFTDYAIAYPSSADGKRIVFQHGYGIALYDPATNQAHDIYFTLNSDRIHARPHRVAVQSDIQGAALGPTGKRVVVESRGQLMSVPVENGDARPLAVQPGSRSQYPAWSPDGKQVAFVSDRSGEEQIWVCPAVGGQPRQVTHDHQGPLGELVWSQDGKWIATGDREMRILIAEVESGVTTMVDQADRAGSYDVTNYSYRFSADGKWLTYARTEPNWNSVVYLYEVAAKKRYQVSSLEMNSFAPAFDTTGKYLLFLSDRAFEPAHQVGRIPSFDQTTKVTLVTLANDTPSPFLAMNDEEGVTEPKPTPTVPTKPGATLPTVKIDIEGLPKRLVDIPVPGGRYQKVEALDGRILLLNSVNDVSQLQAFDMKKRQLSTLISGVENFDLSADHKKLLLRIGKELDVVDASTGPISPGTGHVDLSNLTVMVSPEAEWKQIYAESWRIARDFFYDPKLHGVDWTAVKKKYAAQLPAVGDRSDLNRLLGDMIAELNAGHAYVGGGDAGDLPRPIPQGFLGADLEPTAGMDAYRIVTLLPGDEFDLGTTSPLLTPGINVKPGDYILAVDGQRVRADQDIAALLVGTANRVITLTVNSKPTMDGSRDVRIKPMASENQARYYAWVASRREYVRTHGGENLGYVHIPDMGGGGMVEFNKHYYAGLTSDGMIYDVRNNGGGNISAQLLVQMASKPYLYFKPRYGASWTRADWGFAGASVALCNENSGSNAEEFCDAFQRLKLGPVIGTRTWGGEVGSGGGYRLIDGGLIFIPNYGAWAPEPKGNRWVIEGTGAQPDITVQQDPAALLAGRDPQLDRAIEHLKSELAQHPIVRPVPPPFPNKAVPVAGAK